MTSGSSTTPQDACSWAKGEENTNSGVDGRIQIETPLDFYVVSDHAEFMGVFNQMSNPQGPVSKTELAKRVNSPDSNGWTGSWASRWLSSSRSASSARGAQGTFGTSGPMLKVRRRRQVRLRARRADGRRARVLAGQAADLVHAGEVSRRRVAAWRSPHHKGAMFSTYL